MKVVARIIMSKRAYSMAMIWRFTKLSICVCSTKLNAKHCKFFFTLFCLMWWMMSSSVNRWNEMQSHFTIPHLSVKRHIFQLLLPPVSYVYVCIENQMQNFLIKFLIFETHKKYVSILAPSFCLHFGLSQRFLFLIHGVSKCGSTWMRNYLLLWLYLHRFTSYIIREEIVGKRAREQEGGAERDF